MDQLFEEALPLVIEHQFFFSCLHIFFVIFFELAVSMLGSLFCFSSSIFLNDVDEKFIACVAVLNRPNFTFDGRLFMARVASFAPGRSYQKNFPKSQ